MTAEQLPGPTWDMQPGDYLCHLALRDPAIEPQVVALFAALRSRFEDAGYRVDEQDVTVSVDLKPGVAHFWTMFQAKDMARLGAFQVGMDFGLSDQGAVTVYFVVYRGRRLCEDGSFDTTEPYSLSAYGDWLFEHGKLDWSKGIVRPTICRREPILNQLRELQAFEALAVLTDARLQPVLDALEP